MVAINLFLDENAVIEAHTYGIADTIAVHTKEDTLTMFIMSQDAELAIRLAEMLRAVALKLDTFARGGDLN